MDLVTIRFDNLEDELILKKRAEANMIIFSFDHKKASFPLDRGAISLDYFVL